MKYLVLNTDNTFEYKETDDVEKMLKEEIGCFCFPTQSMFEGLYVVENDCDECEDINYLATTLTNELSFGKCVLLKEEEFSKTIWKKMYLNC